MSLPADSSIDGPLTGQGAVAETILRALPDWFGIEDALVEYVKQTEHLPTFVAKSGNETVGFLAVKQHFEKAAEVYVIGVLPDHHGRGIGRALVEHVERWLADRGVEYLQVKTLGPSRPNEHYERTRLFYESVGFRALEELKTLWDETNPCLLMVKRM